MDTIDRKSARNVPSAPTVFLVDDDRGIRDSLRWLAESVGLHLVSYASAQEFLDAFQPDTPGCLLLDVRMPGMSGLDLQERLNAQCIDIPVIILTAHGDVPMAVRALKAGAFDFLEKPFSDQVLLDQINLALDHDRNNRAKKAENADLLQRLQALSPRERTVMIKVAGGMSNKSIAEELGLSQKTIEVHRAHVMAKVRANSVAELVQIAYRAGLT
ncbi:MAG TPA: response regulator transcription factor [Phycisphaerae bacterium]|nr:response regulator transcription factor [Phycisphaerae bacterium]